MIRGTITIAQERCKGCDLCVQVCPQHVISLDDSIFNAKSFHPAKLNDPDGQCTGCAVCALICPDVCITVFREPPERRESDVARRH